MTINSIIRRSAMAVAATLVAQPLLAAPPAGASEQYARTAIEIVGESSTVRINQVGYDDLNLATAAGKRALDRRLNSAARLVCDDSMSAADYFAASACRTAALASAEPQVAVAVQRAQSTAGTGPSTIAAAIGLVSPK